MRKKQIKKQKFPVNPTPSLYLLFCLSLSACQSAEDAALARELENDSVVYGKSALLADLEIITQPLNPDPNPDLHAVSFEPQSPYLLGFDLDDDHQ